MKQGFRFDSSGMEMTVLCFAESGKNNVALLICHDDGLFVTVRNVSCDDNGSYSWAWGHYFSELHEALADFDERKSAL